MPRDVEPPPPFQFAAKNGWGVWTGAALAAVFDGAAFTDVSGGCIAAKLGLPPSVADSELGLFSFVADGHRVLSRIEPTTRAMALLDDKSDLHHALTARGIAGWAAPATCHIEWDAADAPLDAPSPGDDGLLVLKPCAASGGEGIEFVRGGVEAAMATVRAHAALLVELPFHEEREYIPGFVLQRNMAGVLVRGGRKFHARVFVLMLPDGRSALYDTAEARVAAMPLLSEEGDGEEYPRGAYLTNGAGGTATERLLLARLAMEEAPLLNGALPALNMFMARILAALLPQPGPPPASEGEEGAAAAAGGCGSPPHTSCFALAGVDLMLDEEGGWRLLEFNVNPAAPPPDGCDAAFRAHLERLVAGVASSVLDGKPCGGFSWPAAVRE